MGVSQTNQDDLMDDVSLTGMNNLSYWTKHFSLCIFTFNATKQNRSSF